MDISIKKETIIKNIVKLFAETIPFAVTLLTKVLSVGKVFLNTMGIYTALSSLTDLLPTILDYKTKKGNPFLMVVNILSVLVYSVYLMVVPIAMGAGLTDIAWVSYFSYIALGTKIVDRLCEIIVGLFDYIFKS